MIHLVWNLEYDRYWGMHVLWVGRGVVILPTLYMGIRMSVYVICNPILFDTHVLLKCFTDMNLFNFHNDSRK